MPPLAIPIDTVVTGWVMGGFPVTWSVPFRDAPPHLALTHRPFEFRYDAGERWVSLAVNHCLLQDIKTSNTR
jgi:hypothetical protein